MRHLDEGTIHAWLDGALDADESRRVEAHAASCEACAGAVAAARGMIAAASRILLALDDVPGDVIPGSAQPGDTAPPEVRAGLPRRSAAPQIGRRRWWHSVPLRAAAAIVLLAGGAVLTRDAFSPNTARTTSAPVLSPASNTVELAPLQRAAPPAATLSQAPPSPSGTSAGGAAAPGPLPTSPDRRNVAAAPRPGRPGSRKDVVDGAGEASGATSAPARDAAFGSARQRPRSEGRSDVASAPRAANRAALNEQAMTSPDAQRERAAADSGEAELFTARKAADLQQRVDSARRGVKAAAPPPSVGAVTLAGVASRAQDRTSMTAGAGRRMAGVPTAAAAPMAPSAKQMQSVADKVEQSTPREIPGLRLLKHTVSQLSEGHVVEGRESVERVRYVHTLHYEIVPGAQVQLVVALPLESVAVKPESSAESAIEMLADSAPVRQEGDVTTIHWRETDGSELQLSGRMSVEQLEALRRRVRVPPRRE